MNSLKEKYENENYENFKNITLIIGEINVLNGIWKEIDNPVDIINIYDTLTMKMDELKETLAEYETFKHNRVLNNYMWKEYDHLVFKYKMKTLEIKIQGLYNQTERTEG